MATLVQHVVAQLAPDLEERSVMTLSPEKKEQRPKSAEAMSQARAVLAGGSSSPTRLWGTVGGCPFVVESARGAHLIDVDGNKYLDYLQAFGPAVFGHANSEINHAIMQQLDKGSIYGVPADIEAQLAQAIVDRYKAVEILRFVASGSEATLGALRVMRSFTRRPKVIKFNTGYHGHGDPFQVSPNASTEGQEADGVPASVKADSLVATYNDVPSVEQLFEGHGGQVACVIVEPMIGNHGALPPTKAFLQGLRDLCDKHRALLCFDEVLCGFRCAKGGAYDLCGVMPDMVTMGKVMGGGMPLAAFGGRKDVMAVLSPDGPVFQAGTYAGTPVCLAAGLKALEILDRPGTYEQLDRRSRRLSEGLVAAARQAGHAAWGCSYGGMLGFVFHEGPLQTFEDMQNINQKKLSMFFQEMVNRSILWWPKTTGLAFVSLAHTEHDIEHTISVASTVFQGIPRDLEGPVPQPMPHT